MRKSSFTRRNVCPVWIAAGGPLVHLFVLPDEDVSLSAVSLPDEIETGFSGRKGVIFPYRCTPTHPPPLPRDTRTIFFDLASFQHSPLPFSPLIFLSGEKYHSVPCSDVGRLKRLKESISDTVLRPLKHHHMFLGSKLLSPYVVVVVLCTRAIWWRVASLVGI